MPLEVVLTFLTMRDVVRSARVGRSFALAACAHVEDVAPAFFTSGTRASFSDHCTRARRRERKERKEEDESEDEGSPYSRCNGNDDDAGDHHVSLIGRWLMPHETAEVYVDRLMRRPELPQPMIGVVGLYDYRMPDFQTVRPPPPYLHVTACSSSPTTPTLFRATGC